MSALTPYVNEIPLHSLFVDARTHSAWKDEPVDDATLQRIYELTRMAPTAANISPLRVVYVKSAAAKERLRPTLAPMNVDKTMQAPATAILAWDSRFTEQLPKLFPGRDLKGQLESIPTAARDEMASLSAHLQAGYFILAARSLGLDAGPMGGFDKQKVDATFFPDGEWKSFLVVNLGHGDPNKLFPRLPRLEFAEAGRIE
jgi:3-hydroxypropanoate dehydrogenase